MTVILRGVKNVFRKHRLKGKNGRAKYRTKGFFVCVTAGMREPAQEGSEDARSKDPSSPVQKTACMGP